MSPRVSNQVRDWAPGLRAERFSGWCEPAALLKVWAQQEAVSSHGAGAAASERRGQDGVRFRGR